MRIRLRLTIIHCIAPAVMIAVASACFRDVPSEPLVAAVRSDTVCMSRGIEVGPMVDIKRGGTAIGVFIPADENGNPVIAREDSARIAEEIRVVERCFGRAALPRH